MTKLICSGCERTVDVKKVHGDEVCKECKKPMNEVTETAPVEQTAEQIVNEVSVPEKEVQEETKKEEGKVTLPVNYNFCGELPNFQDNEVI